MVCPHVAPGELTYQSASRYWAFQFAETGLHLLLTLLLAGFCLWRVNRQLGG
jgi:hypothetical protein